MKLFFNHVFFVFLFMLLIGCSGPQVTGIYFEGKVVDKETGKPIESALVYAEWRSLYVSGIVESHSSYVCQKVKLAKTDSSGKFGFYGIIASLGVTYHPDIYVYKKGYEMPLILIDTKPGVVIELEKNKKTQRERLEYLNKLSKAPACIRPYSKTAKQSRDLANKYLGSIYKEAHNYIFTKNDVRDVVINFCFRRANMEVGGSPVEMYSLIGPKHDIKRRKLIDEYINKNLPTCKLEYLQKLRRKNIYSLLNKISTTYAGGRVSGCVNKVATENNKKSLINIDGGGIFSIKNPKYLGEKSVPVYLPLADTNISVEEKQHITLPYLTCLAGSGYSMGRSYLNSIQGTELERLDEKCRKKTRKLLLDTFKEKKANGFSEKFFSLHKEIERTKKELYAKAMVKYGQPYKSQFSPGDPIDTRFVMLDITANKKNRPVNLTVLTRDIIHSMEGGSLLMKGWKGKRIDLKAEYDETYFPVELYDDPRKHAVMTMWVKKLKSCR